MKKCEIRQQFYYKSRGKGQSLSYLLVNDYIARKLEKALLVQERVSAPLLGS